MTVVFFDLDETLYDQLLPFENAFRSVFHVADFKMVDLYLDYRKHSDHVFHLTESGEMSMSEMYRYRIQKAMEKFGYQISDEAAMAFQDQYAFCQTKITLSQKMVEILDVLKENQVTLGILTNGPSLHQRDKMKQLNLSNWFPQDKIVISSEVGYAKPNQMVFDKARQTVAEKEEQLFFYIGDSLTNDVSGAIASGWQPIWFNRRHLDSENLIDADHIVTTDRQLFTKLKEIIGQKVEI